MNLTLLLIAGASLLLANPKIECLAWSLLANNNNNGSRKAHRSLTMVVRKAWNPLQTVNVPAEANPLISINNFSRVAPRYTSATTMDRRSFTSFICLGTSALFPSYSFATEEDEEVEESLIPTVTVEEFEKILNSSARSVQRVDFFSYSKSNQKAVITLVDGTTFGLSDLIESSVDPRSPLKLVATLKQYKVPYRFPLLDAALSKTETSGKRKSYLNEAAMVAAKKEEAKRGRMKQDEEDRIAEVKRNLKE